MNSKKYFIQYGIKEGPYGGGNQFLSALKNQFKKNGVYSDRPEDSYFILFNSHHDTSRVIELKSACPDKIFIHRVDGPMRLYNDLSDKRDAKVITVNNLAADGTVFQSDWSREANKNLGWSPAGKTRIIGNAPDPEVFNTTGKSPFREGGKTRLIASSWSQNVNKGFDVYEYLDETLDFDEYEMRFIGNSPMEFRNIIHIPPCDSAVVAGYLKSSDIFVTASKSDPCSNSLIEALHCGLPAVARNCGGHPEIIGECGELFDNAEDIAPLIRKIERGYDGYRSKFSCPDIAEISSQYESFAEELLALRESGNLPVKKIGIIRKIKSYFI